ncbi:MAG: galactokinase [Oscillospiraceae bacterium]|nr:galactokinase [Oscillospiraceae bacterium]
MKESVEVVVSGATLNAWFHSDINEFASKFGDRDGVRLFSAPGRVEIGGNHTDHQCGRVLAAAINLDASAVARANGQDKVRLYDVNFGSSEICLSKLDINNDERGTTAALVRGVAAWYSNNGFPIGGFDAVISSNVPIGAGLSSSAAFEVLIGNIFRGLYRADISPIEIAKAGQFSENKYFGKPCGLMDQTASSFGGLNIIDFRDMQKPLVTQVDANFPGYSLCVVSTGGSHADLTPDYEANIMEMQSVAAYFGKKYLREVPSDEFYSSISRMRHLGDRAILRAIHFFGDNERVLKQADALKNGNLAVFLELVVESGRSSLAYLQNVYSPSNPQQQGLTLALALSEKILAGAGAWRVHGGGFAGTILAFVPNDMKEQYNRSMCDVFGEGCCQFLSIREEGGVEVIM